MISVAYEIPLDLSDKPLNTQLIAEKLFATNDEDGKLTISKEDKTLIKLVAEHIKLSDI